jgi:hypothetical protein
MIAPQLTVFLPFVASALAAWLVSAKLSQLFNGLIIAIAFLVAIALCILTGGPLTSLTLTNIIIDCAAVFAALKPLMDFVAPLLPSPLALLAPKATPGVAAPPPQSKV